MSKGLIDIIDEYREYFYKEFPTPEHKAVYRNLRKSYLLAMWLNLTAGFSGIHCLYLNSYMFFVYLYIILVIFQNFNGIDIQILLYLCIFEMFRIPFVVFLYNLKIKKYIIVNDINKDIPITINSNSSFVGIVLTICIVLFQYYSMDVFVFWHYLLNLPYIY